jgi:hypothetical protein
VLFFEINIEILDSPISLEGKSFMSSNHHKTRKSHLLYERHSLIICCVRIMQWSSLWELSNHNRSHQDEQLSSRELPNEFASRAFLRFFDTINVNAYVAMEIVIEAIINVLLSGRRDSSWLVVWKTLNRIIYAHIHRYKPHFPAWSPFHCHTDRQF